VGTIAFAPILVVAATIIIVAAIVGIRDNIAAGVHPFRVTEQIEPRRVLVIDAENSERQWVRDTKYVTQLTGSLGQGDPDVRGWPKHARPGTVGEMP
jgi:hypothetical protein